jgi:long-chain acyl-CoA synthetase
VELNDSIPALLEQRVRAHGSETVLRKKDRGIWNSVTWHELGAYVREIGQGLLATGFGPGDVAAILSETRPEFAYIDLAILGSGGASVAIHPEEESRRVGHILHSAGCRLAFVENEEQLDKVLAVRAECPALSRIVILDMKGLREFSDPQCTSLDTFIAEGAGTNGWDRSVSAVTASQPAIVLFPRNEIGGAGRTLTHGDVMHLIANARERLGVRAGDERLAVLPMCDVTERVLGLYLALDGRVVSNYLESPETATENLQQAQPTVFGADAEAWTRLHERITRAADGATPLQRAFYRWAIKAATARGGMAALADLLVLRAVRRELGMAKLRLAYVGGAPVPPDVQQWAAALGIAIQRIDAPAVAGVPTDPRYLALMEEAYCST